MKTDECKAGSTMLMTLVAIVLIGTESVTADFILGEPQNLGSPINTPYGDYNVYISADSLELYVSSDRPGGLGYFDMWRSTRENADHPWGPLVNVQEINSCYNEVFPCLSADGLTFYFSDWYYTNAAGDRPGGVGDHDLWMSTRLSTADPWGQPINMGAVVNSVYAEVSPCVSQDGQTLIFASKRPGGFGNYDLWMSTRPTAESEWVAPVNMGATVNSSAYDGETCLSNDGLALFFSSDRPGGMGTYDLWVTTRRSQVAAWSPPVNLGPAFNTSYWEGAPSLSPDLKTLYFLSDRPGGMGGYDMYEVPIIPILDFNGDGTVDMKDLLRLIQSWGQDDSTTDIGPAPWGDGVVDAADLEVLMSYWGQEVPNPYLIAHWKLDETEGVVANDSAGANDGVLVGNPRWQPTGGKLGGALQLDGVDDCVTVAYVRDPSEGPFSVFAWVRGGAPGQVVIAQEKGADWLMVTPDGALKTGLKGPGRSDETLVSSAVITDDAWHRIGLVWDGSSRILYVDDIEVARDTQTQLVGTYTGLHVGAGSTLAPGSFWWGLIDDVRIYKRAVTP